jgi:hypothetical protein
MFLPKRAGVRLFLNLTLSTRENQIGSPLKA